MKKHFRFLGPRASFQPTENRMIVLALIFSYIMLAFMIYLLMVSEPKFLEKIRHLVYLFKFH